MPRRSLAQNSFTTDPAPPSTADVSETDAGPLTKCGVMLNQRDVDRWETLCTQGRHRTGRRVTKSEILRAMLALTADDVSLAEQLISSLPVRSSEE